VKKEERVAGVYIHVIKASVIIVISVVSPFYQPTYQVLIQTKFFVVNVAGSSSHTRWFDFFSLPLFNMSAGSGILPSPESLAIVDELRKNNSKYSFGLFKVEGNAVVPDTQFARTAGDDHALAAAFEKTVWPQFIRALESANGPRFGVIDFAFANAEGRIVRTLVSISYCPDKGVPAKLKMTFASTKTSFEAKINIGKKYQANDISDLEYKTVLDFVGAGK